MKTLVIPSNRETNLKSFLKAWGGNGGWDKIILVEDNPTKTFNIDVHEHYSHQEINDILGDYSWIISRRDSAIRSFGYLMAYRSGAEYILTLDDDCLPHTGKNYHYSKTNLFDEHIKSMTNHTRWVSSIPGLRVRGLPYINQGQLTNVVISMGLWAGCPDLDAPTSLTDLDFATNMKFKPPDGSWIVPKNQYIPFCGMNVCFKREITPALYFPLMGENQDGMARFDDIHGGILLKKILDHLGLSLSVGEPQIFHSKASNVFANLVKEAKGIGVNESFWEVVDDVKLTSDNVLGCVIELGEGLEKNESDYISKVGSCLKIWGRLYL